MPRLPDLEESGARPKRRASGRKPALILPGVVLTVYTWPGGLAPTVEVQTQDATSEAYATRLMAALAKEIADRMGIPDQRAA